ncbi:phage holin family protein [Plantactinospora sp. WMMB334]|uniref:phage holin family protein n=1 Tax=Plantactinospora sp. WMMB334 TaxID=3404119 RepID=UPI003B95F3D6
MIRVHRADDSLTGAAAPGDRLARDVRELAVQEAMRFRADLAESARRAGLGAALLAGAGIAALLGLGAASAAVLSLVDARLPARRSTAVLAAGYLGGAALLAVTGLTRLRAAGGRTDRVTTELRGIVAGVRAGRR